jgi:MFS family permease
VKVREAIHPAYVGARQRIAAAPWALGRALGQARGRWGAQWRVRSPEEHNERIMYLEAAFQSVSSAGAMSFITVFLVRLGAASWLVGLHEAIGPLMAMVAVLPMGALAQRQRNMAVALNWSRGAFRTVIGSFALLPLLPAHIAPYALVAGHGVASVPGSMIDVASMTLSGQITTPERRPRMLSVRWGILGLCAAVLGFGVGHWLDWAPYPLNYQVLFISAFIAGLGSIWAISKLILEDAPPPIMGSRRTALRNMVPLLKEAAAFRRFAAAAFVFRLGLWMPMALFSIYRVRILGASDAWLGTLLTVERVLSVVAYILLSRLLARRNLHRWLWLSAVGMALFPIATALSTNTTMLLIPAVIGGLVSPALNICLTDTLFRVSPEDDRPVFVAMNSFLASLTGFLGPLLGTALAEATSISFALMAGGGLRVVGGLTFWLLSVGAEDSSADAENGTEG